MVPSTQASVGDLVDRLLADALIDACHMTAEVVTIIQGTRHQSFPYEQAHSFLVGMVGGRSWSRGASPVGLVNESRDPNIESSLLELLRLACELQLIERFEMLGAERRVTIETTSPPDAPRPDTARKCTLSFAEAVDFLHDRIVHAFRSAARRIDTASTGALSWRKLHDTT